MGARRVVFVGGTLMDEWQEKYYRQLRTWGLERRGRSTERYAEFATQKGTLIWVRKPIGLTEEQCRVELVGLAKQYGFDPPDLW
jgi:hypothetical protein